MKNKMIMFRLLTVFTPVVLYTSIYTVYNILKKLETELNRGLITSIGLIPVVIILLYSVKLDREQEDNVEGDENLLIQIVLNIITFIITLYLFYRGLVFIAPIYL